MRRVALIFFFFGVFGIVHAGGLHQGDHLHKETKAHWQAPQEAIDQINPILADNESIELGRKIYVDLCARCHGMDALGNGPDALSLSTQPSNLMAMSGGHADGDFAWKIKNGRNEMPEWGDELDDTEIWSLVNFIQSLSKKTEAHNNAHN